MPAVFGNPGSRMRPILFGSYGIHAGCEEYRRLFSVARWVLPRSQHQANAVKRFALQCNELMTGLPSCLDQVLFKGYLPLG